MNLKNLLQAPEGCIIIAFILIYFLVNCYILYRFFIKGERRLYIKKLLLAFGSFCLLGLQELSFYIYCNTAGIQYSSIALFNIKLFIYTAFFIIMTLQSMGFLKDKIKVCFQYHLMVMFTLLVMDIIYCSLNLSREFYAVILSGLLIVIIMFLAWKLISMGLKRYDTILRTLQKKTVRRALVLLGAEFIVLYAVFVSLVAMENVFLSVFVLFVIIVIHALFVYIDRHSYTIKRSYNVGEYKHKESYNDILMEERVNGDFKIIQRLVFYFESEKPYLDSDLKLGDVAQRIYTNKTYLSRALNHRMNKNFNQFVNYYRIREACKYYIANPSVSLNDLCLKSGFKNLSSFSGAFSLNIRYTPAEWCKEIKKKISNNEAIDLKDYLL